MIEALEANADATRLTVTWEGGRASELSAATLRREAMDAASKRERIETGAVAVPEGLSITGIYQVGAMGVNVHFSDGHDKAIYPFVYLRELSDRFDN